MLNKKYAEITLDGAGICLFNGSYQGLFTRKINTCVVLTVRFHDRFLFIHDTAQLNTTSLTELSKSCGDALELGVFFGENALKNEHESRVVNFANSIGIEGKDIINIPSGMNEFNLCLDKDGGFLFSEVNETLQGLDVNPRLEIIEDIIKFNNFFIPPNSQSINVDVQFNGENYLNNTQPIHSIESVLKSIENQPDFFDLNIIVFAPMVRRSLITTPRWISDYIDSIVAADGFLKNTGKTQRNRYQDFISLIRKNSV
ncbi:hypothetical protein [Klebsiella quasipneumoniae]|uniref:hypothetical protein n=1 Tax=Klebsiella quasipneumoniae TaxID=1463165 RepID=UPI000C7B0BAE|nr:hypothetical protein [Klebsiella quasipneumoniae]PLJ35545.1 hypothetical protein B6J67_28390 [Klebsiella quasipneumoniae]